jgi:Membrane transport protein
LHCWPQWRSPSCFQLELVPLAIDQLSYLRFLLQDTEQTISIVQGQVGRWAVSKCMIAEALVPIFFVMFLGYFAGARRIINNQHVASLIVLLLTFAVPVAAFGYSPNITQRTRRERKTCLCPCYFHVGDFRDHIRS